MKDQDVALLFQPMFLLCAIYTLKTREPRESISLENEVN